MVIAPLLSEGHGYAFGPYSSSRTASPGRPLLASSSLGHLIYQLPNIGCKRRGEQWREALAWLPQLRICYVLRAGGLARAWPGRGLVGGRGRAW